MRPPTVPATDDALRLAAVGAGFWSRDQLAAWKELPDAACVALCDRDRARAGIAGRKPAETTAEDDLKTMEMVFASYESPRTGEAVRLGGAP